MPTKPKKPKAPKPDANQLAFLTMAKATGTPLPAHLKKFANYVKKAPKRK